MNSRSTAKQRKNSRGRPWRPGQSGNPSGRPKSPHAIANLLRELGTRPADPETLSDLRTAIPGLSGYGMSRLQAVCCRVWQQALSGDMTAANFIADRTEGKPVPMGSPDVNQTVIIIGGPDIPV